MHGVVLWRYGEAWYERKSGDYGVGQRVSRLYTWQDGRCTQEFLASLPRPKSHLRLATGFGCATLFWLERHEPALLQQYDCAGTIQDYVIAMLCNLQKPVMSTQNAASWGYFDTAENDWNMTELSKSGFPVHLLPSVKPPGSFAGCIFHTWCSIPSSAVVSVALGDLQCSILSKLHVMDNNHCAVINIGTSAQICFEMPDSFSPRHLQFDQPKDGLQKAVEYFPYFGGRYLAVAASLNGGNILACFVEMLQQWISVFGCHLSADQIWTCLHVSVVDVLPVSSLPVIIPTIFGERHQPDGRGVVTNITPANMSLPSVYQAICRGIAQNLGSMMPPQMLHDANVVRILGSGSTLVRNICLQKELQELYKLPIEIEGCEAHDAAVGAALTVFNSIQQTAVEKI